jgi:hypothetical protein
MATRRRQIRAPREHAARTDGRVAAGHSETCPVIIQIKRGILDEVTSKFPRRQKSEFS